MKRLPQYHSITFRRVLSYWIGKYVNTGLHKSTPGFQGEFREPDQISRRRSGLNCVPGSLHVMRAPTILVRREYFGDRQASHSARPPCKVLAWQRPGKSGGDEAALCSTRGSNYRGGKINSTPHVNSSVCGLRHRWPGCRAALRDRLIGASN